MNYEGPSDQAPWWTRIDMRDPRTGSLYLSRWVLFSCVWFSVYLHRIHAPDPGREGHNHPWRAICIVLRGWYIHARQAWYESADPDPDFSFWKPPFAEHVRWINVLRRDEYHRITRVSPNLWTLCITGPRFHDRDWTFLVDGKPMSWREYIEKARNGEV